MEMNWDEWFKFPIIILNRDWEEVQREKKVMSGEEITADYSYIVGECEVPYWDELVNIYDVFRPSEKSFMRAREKNVFNTCSISFKMAGDYTVPWPKEKFKEEYSKFLSTIKEEEPKSLVSIPLEEIPEDIKEFFKNKIEQNDRRDDTEGVQGLPLDEEENS